MKAFTIISLVFCLTAFGAPAQDMTETTTPSGLRYIVLKQGTGETPKEGEMVAIYESMEYLSGKQFYAIDRPSPPITFTVGKKQVIQGVEEAVRSMKVGEVRKLIVPPSLSKRDQYPEHLSKDSTLVYRVELVEIIRE